MRNKILGGSPGRRMMTFISSYFHLVLGTLLVFWGVMVLGHLRDKISILFNLESQEDPSLKLMVVGYCLYHLGAFFLVLFTLGSLVMDTEFIFSKPYLIVTLITAAALAPAADYLFTKAAGDASDPSRFLDIVRVLNYTIKQRRTLERALKAKRRVAPHYLKGANVSARTVRPSIIYLRKFIGAEATAKLVADMGVPINYLEYHESKIHVSFAMDLLAKIRELTGDPRAPFYAQSCGGNLECMGSMFYLLSRWWSVKQCYKTVIKVTSEMDTVMRYEITELSDTSMTLKAIPRDLNLVRSHSRDGLYSVQGWLSAIPNIKGLPHASVEEIRTVFDVAEDQTLPEYCEWRIRWVNSIYDGALLSSGGLAQRE